MRIKENNPTYYVLEGEVTDIHTEKRELVANLNKCYIKDVQRFINDYIMARFSLSTIYIYNYYYPSLSATLIINDNHYDINVNTIHYI